MTHGVDVVVAAGMVACGDEVKGSVTWSSETSPPTQIRLVCRLTSDAPRAVVVATCDLATSEDSTRRFRLRVPVSGPITHRGVSLAVSWSVMVVDANATALGEVPLVVAPRGGVALWLQRHAPPPN